METWAGGIHSTWTNENYVHGRGTKDLETETFTNTHRFDAGAHFSHVEFQCFRHFDPFEDTGNSPLVQNRTYYFDLYADASNLLTLISDTQRLRFRGRYLSF